MHNLKKHTMSSRIVFLKRRKNTTKIPDNLYAEAKRKIGGKITMTGEPLKGLTPMEEDKWLPLLLATPVTDVTYRKKVNDFWSNISIIVDNGKDGTKLETGLDDHSKEPISLMDYIKYRYILKCPEVATDEHALKSDPTKKYFLYDPSLAKEQEFVDMELRKTSYREFIIISSDDKNPDRVDHLFRMLTGKNPDIFDKKDKSLELEKISRDRPKEFLKYAGNKNLEMESLIAKAVSLEIIHKFGETYRFGDVLLGDSIDSAVAFINDKRYSEILTTVKQKIKEFDRINKYKTTPVTQSTTHQAVSALAETLVKPEEGKGLVNETANPSVEAVESK